ncbi:MAG: glycosyltransferase family 4 protein [Alphaproteobacteria bacterium]|nr:glycosyltransferase family 4 protein [Alphaproteobacteria bacterium]
MAAPIAYDVARLFVGSLSVTPRGIDRVDLLYARFLFEAWAGDCFVTLPTPWGVRLYDRDRTLELIDRVEELWSETIEPYEDQVLSEIKNRLSGNGHQPRFDKPRGDSRGVNPITRFFKVLAVTGFSFGDSVVRSVPKNSIYVNVGHITLKVPWLTSWLEHRPDVKSVFMVHDVIPLEHPEFFPKGEYRLHENLIAQTARYASGLIVPTAAARESVLNALRRQGRVEIPVETAPLPVTPIFLEKDWPDEELGKHDYFVVCGAIEPRKNHLLLLNVWRELVRKRGERAPRLVVVGSPIWRIPSLLRELERCRPLQGQVIFARGLSSPALRRLIAHAKALLMPSFAEGFGLPVIEALAVGTPVIASDLPVHREIAGDLAVYRDPTDGSGWLEDICMFADGNGPAAEIRKRVSAYQPPTWREYFTRIEHFLKTFEQP